ncbi:MAG TPA: HNH endonuclease [Planctomycetota bacterium]|nr:HNH endonuclease [Planctomycetota bacterium]
MSAEKWAAVPDFPGYEVSSRGRVRSFRVPKLLRIEGQGRGHASVWLMQNGKPRRRAVHRLVLLAFAGRPAEGLEACHNDGDLKNNRLENLRWDTHRNNMADKLRHGTQPRGESHHSAKVSRSDSQQIKRLLAEGKTGVEVARIFGVSGTTVSEIKRGRHWTDFLSHAKTRSRKERN